MRGAPTARQQREDCTGFLFLSPSSSFVLRHLHQHQLFVFSPFLEAVAVSLLSCARREREREKPSFASALVKPSRTMCHPCGFGDTCMCCGTARLPPAALVLRRI